MIVGKKILFKKILVIICTYKNKNSKEKKYARKNLVYLAVVSICLPKFRVIRVHMFYYSSIKTI